MQMMAFDYVKGMSNGGGSLAKLASLIAEARAEITSRHGACLLFDNGDTFQGNPITEFIVRNGCQQVHPIVACMNALQYDAGGLGNHDFDHGLDALASWLTEHKMPVVCTNVMSASLPDVCPDLMLERAVTFADGTADTIRIGVLSSLPDKTALWSRHHVQDRANICPPLPKLKTAAATLRAQGADLIVVLAHMGLALFDEGPEAQNQISDVARIEDVDVVIGGHTHLRFPGPDHSGVAEADCNLGTVHGTPVVQPGASASDLGVIDLYLGKPEGSAAWQVTSATSKLVPVTKNTPECPEILKIAQDAHSATMQYLAEPVATMDKSIHSFFALAQPSPVPALLAAAKRRTIAEVIADTADSNLPLVAVASAQLTGGFDGPDNFLALSKGVLQRRHIAGLNPYANHVWAVKTTGAQLLDWLERSALIFNTLAANAPDQLLVDPRIPGFRYDAIYGLTYTVDPRQPPRFDISGKVIASNKGRIRDIRYHGKPISWEQEFIVATTDHRAGGGGVYKTFSSQEIVMQGHAPLQEAVLAYLQSPDRQSAQAAPPWSFPHPMNRTAILHTAPEACDYLDEIAHLNPEQCGETPDGFLRLRLHL